MNDRILEKAIKQYLKEREELAENMQEIGTSVNNLRDEMENNEKEVDNLITNNVNLQNIRQEKINTFTYLKERFDKLSGKIDVLEELNKGE